MINRSSKGVRIQNELKKLLLSKGFIVDAKTRPQFPKKPRLNDYSQSCDLFGCWDIVARHSSNPDKTFWFQVSVNWKHGKALNELNCFMRSRNDILVMARKLPRREFEFKIYFEDCAEWIISDIEKIFLL